MIKLFVSDLDGTLLNDMHMTDFFILETIQKVKENGFLFSSATGRSLHEHEVNRLQLNDVYRISMNRSLIKDPEGKILYSQSIDMDFINEFLDMFYGLDCDYSSDEHTLSTISMDKKLNTLKLMVLKKLQDRPFIFGIS